MRNTATAGRGAIYNSQMLVINDSTFDANLISVLKKSGAIDQPTFGGGIFSTGFCRISDCFFISNTATASGVRSIVNHKMLTVPRMVL